MVGKGRVAVYTARTRDIERSGYDRLHELLDDAERERAARFVFRDSTELYIAAHALVRLALSEHADLPPKDWRFEADKRGCPSIRGALGDELHFNLSHTGGLVAVAVADFRAIGVDVEERVRRVEYQKLAERFFARSEARGVGETSGVARRERFFWHWTLKEAYLKARGIGIGLPLDAFAFDPDDRPIRLHCEEGFDPDRDHWQFEVARPTPEHQLALAALPGFATPVRFELVSGDSLLWGARQVPAKS